MISMPGIHWLLVCSMLLQIALMGIFVVFIVGFLAFIYYLLFLTTKARNGIPPEWPFVGILPSLFIHFNHLYDSISEILIGCGGTFVAKGLPQTTVLTSNPANVEYILTTRFSSFPKGPGFRCAFRDVFGDGLFNVDGELWIQQRKASVVEFNSVSSLTYVLNSVQDSLRQNLIPVLDNTISKGSANDLQDMLFRFTFDNIGKIVFGVHFHICQPFLSGKHSMMLNILSPLWKQLVESMLAMWKDSRIELLQNPGGLKMMPITQRAAVPTATPHIAAVVTSEGCGRILMGTNLRSDIHLWRLPRFCLCLFPPMAVSARALSVPCNLQCFDTCPDQ